MSAHLTSPLKDLFDWSDQNIRTIKSCYLSKVLLEFTRLDPRIRPKTPSLYLETLQFFEKSGFLFEICDFNLKTG